MNVRPLFRLKTGLQTRPYFFISFVVTILLYLLLQTLTSWSWSTNLLLSWNIAISGYLFSTMTKLWQADHQHILQRAQQQDASKWLILFLVLMTLVMCFIAIVIEVNHLPKDPFIRISHLALSMLTIVSAWFFMHTIFAIHYAHDFYLAIERSLEGGLDFPKTKHPTYPDFIYFSYVIGTSAQTADVSITTRAMRELNTLHILLAYGFNTSILAIIINVVASFLQS
ncbi:hypothetical protein B9T33_00450 [Acinetobacter sp. ANC 5054]|uniref:DUF1345 domain-containing protein n=1 Tax=Acinetobacter sp. ANC 5054 TaxID=1977877 RepID=UPI000A347FD4|nr:DUF1345 domain-containing protein [Acinetobacter sp. ANC 5054]OTG84308.1 hypothetical protein B9T33_00450 [Acinetobacter sp. ANC 5054]